MKPPSMYKTCSVTYQKFRCEFTWSDAFASFWTLDEPRSNWIHKTKRNILGCLWELKQNTWRQHLDSCSPIIESNES